MANKILNLDLSKNPIMQPIIYGRVGDGYSPTITVNITDNDEIVDLTDYVIKFEGVTSKDTFVVDPGITSSAAGLKTGTFSYLFPSRAFSVLGQYKLAYFSFVKGFTRKTTGNFKIIVADIADISKEEAKAVIIEYDQLVEKLNASYTAAVKAYDEESQKKLLALQKQIDQQMAAQDAKIETQSKAIGTVNTQIDAINKSISSFETRMKKLENDGAILAEDTLTYRRDTILGDKYNWDSFTTTGIYRVSVAPTFTTNNPPDSGGLYGFLSVTSLNQTGTHIQQTYVDYTGKEYTRFKVSGTTWNKWNRTQVQAITEYGGSSFNIGSSDGSILAVLKRDAPLYRSYAVYGPNLSDGPPSTSVFRFTAQMTDASTGNVIGVTDSGIMYYRGISGGNWSTGWISPNNAQMKKITNDDGTATAISSGTIISSILSNGAGVKTYSSDPSLSDSPHKSSTFRFIANMTNSVSGNVIGVTNGNEMYARNIWNGTWSGDWIKVVDENKLLDKIYPIGSVYMSVTSQDPATLFGGTWQRYAQGRTLFGASDTDADFSNGKAGGAKTITIERKNLPNGSLYRTSDAGGTGWNPTGSVASGWRNGSLNDLYRDSTTDKDVPIDNLPPYLTCYIWRRTA